ncbi:hypothetical protein GCM10010424_63270 [Streptomyces lienomycini]
MSGQLAVPVSLFLTSQADHVDSHLSKRLDPGNYLAAERGDVRERDLVDFTDRRSS